MSDKRPVHAVLRDLAVDDDCLLFAGRRLTDIATEVGGTPFYAYDRAAIAARVALLREHLPAAVELHYAMKANPMPDVVEHLLGLVDGLDVASAGELEIALERGGDPATISFAGPGKRDEELERAAAAGVVINLESFNE